MFAPFENPTAMTRCRSKPYLSAAASRKSRQLFGAPVQVFHVEHSFRQTPEEARRSALHDVSAHAEQSCARQQGATERNQIALVAARAVQQEERGRDLRRRRLPHVYVRRDSTSHRVSTGFTHRVHRSSVKDSTSRRWGRKPASSG